MRKVLICALALSGFAYSAQAADLGGSKDSKDELTWKGVTVFGTIDAGYAYQTNGAPFDGNNYYGLNYNVDKSNRKEISSLVSNGLSQSTIGLKVEEKIGYGFTVVGQADTGFNPVSGEISDMCKGLAQNNGKSPASWDSAGDGSRCGQAINGQGFVGLANSKYGKLTVGRQNSFVGDMGKYDPQGGSYAFSAASSGTAWAGSGITETGRWDNSLKYTYSFGPLRAGVMYASGNQDSSIHGDAVAGTAGFSYKGLSIDAAYTNVKGGISVATNEASSALGSDQLKGTVADTEAYAIAGKYVYNLGGSFKDDEPSAKLTFFGGYQHSELSNSSKTIAIGDTTIGGYSFSSVNNTPYYTNRVLQTAFGGVKLEYPSGWTFTGAYYNVSQDGYYSNATTYKAEGDNHFASFVVDYAFNKHVDVYTGVSYSEKTGGQAADIKANGFDPYTTNVVSGIRLKF